jgi:hypothetical protein
MTCYSGLGEARAVRLKKQNLENSVPRFLSAEAVLDEYQIVDEQSRGQSGHGQRDADHPDERRAADWPKGRVSTKRSLSVGEIP